jgi:hypothetical protein
MFSVEWEDLRSARYCFFLSTYVSHLVVLRTNAIIIFTLIYGLTVKKIILFVY